VVGACSRPVCSRRLRTCAVGTREAMDEACATLVHSGLHKLKHRCEEPEHCRSRLLRAWHTQPRLVTCCIGHGSVPLLNVEIVVADTRNLVQAAAPHAVYDVRDAVRFQQGFVCCRLDGAHVHSAATFARLPHDIERSHSSSEQSAGRLARAAVAEVALARCIAQAPRRRLCRIRSLEQRSAGSVIIRLCRRRCVSARSWLVT
jgi:hypothetical protein